MNKVAKPFPKRVALAILALVALVSVLAALPWILSDHGLSFMVGVMS